MTNFIVVSSLLIQKIVTFIDLLKKLLQYLREAFLTPLILFVRAGKKARRRENSRIQTGVLCTGG